MPRGSDITPSPLDQLVSPPTEPAPPTRFDGQGPDETVALPEVPGYEVLRELGRGGMGVVYLARQAALKRLVVLKMLRDGNFAGPEQMARFRKAFSTCLEGKNYIVKY